ncbi:DUF6069 family protein [Antribacter gilvus]|uniref:DUF6069 family protein n=1 Tax=Antribacter gilvus TaxID=2304675 RepID=UPI000F7A79F5|nr:DUF6069 family protein [Antribacter gilvus]
MTSTTSEMSSIAAKRKITPAHVAVVTVVALAINLVILWFGPLAGASMQVGQPAPVTAIPVAFFTIVPLLLASVVVALAGRRNPGFRRIAAWAGLAFALVSCAAPFAVAADTATAYTLSAMHVVCGVAWFRIAYPHR